MFLTDMTFEEMIDNYMRTKSVPETSYGVVPWSAYYMLWYCTSPKKLCELIDCYSGESGEDCVATIMHIGAMHGIPLQDYAGESKAFLLSLYYISDILSMCS